MNIESFLTVIAWPTCIISGLVLIGGLWATLTYSISDKRIDVLLYGYHKSWRTAITLGLIFFLISLAYLVAK